MYQVVKVVMPRLSIEISETEHRKIKALAALSGKSVREYVIERVFPNKNPSTDTLNAINDAITERNLSSYASVEALMDEITQDADPSEHKPL